MAIKFVHKVNLGDLVSVLAGVRHLCKMRNEKAVIYQMLNRPGEYYTGAVHPTVNERGEMVCFNMECYDKMKPLLLAQEYIEDFRVYQGEKVDYDLDVVRQQVYCGAPHFPLHKWTWMAYPEMACDLSESWLTVPEKEHIGKVVINFTERYRNYNINYFFLKAYQEHICFVGTASEHEKFKEQWRADVQFLVCDNFLSLAALIKRSKFFLGNQSFCWHLAQAMHVPRILELYPFAQNCTNFGANGYEFYHQHQLEFYFDKLFNE